MLLSRADGSYCSSLPIHLARHSPELNSPVDHHAVSLQADATPFSSLTCTFQQ